MVILVSIIKGFVKIQIFVVLFISASILKADPYSLKNLSEYLTNLKLLKANFFQVNADGSESSGIILLKRPGRMRFEYDKPDKTLVLVAAGALAIFDPKGDQEPMTYPVRNNPISLLLNSEIDLINSGIVSNYMEASEKAILIIRDPITPERGSVELLFSGAQPELKKFTVKNENGTSTSIALEDTEYPKNINDTLFSISLEINKRKDSDK
ncbi:MAG: outer membrane lipoprotein carrier protein LolA [Rhodobacterales bacterium]|nr:outer membrane lipoprotein carrier protein LolA [Rhodobacterales bacterium]